MACNRLTATLKAYQEARMDNEQNKGFTDDEIEAMKLDSIKKRKTARRRIEQNRDDIDMEIENGR